MYNLIKLDNIQRFAVTYNHTEYQLNKISNMNTDKDGIDLKNWVSNLSTLKDIKITDPSGYITNLDSLFSEKQNLETVDFTDFNTSRVLSTNNMFWRCNLYSDYGLENYSAIINFDTSNVISMVGMFANSNITDWPNLNTTKVTNMYAMFSANDPGIYNLSWGRHQIFNTFPTYDTSNVTNMQGFLYGTIWFGLDSYNLNTNKVTDMSYAFSSTLGYIPSDDGPIDSWIFPSLNTSNVINMCELVSHSPVRTVPMFNTRKVTNIYHAFNDCWQIDYPSIQNIVNSLPLYSNLTPLTIPDNTLAHIGFDSEQIEKVDRLVALNAVNKGWNVPINWRTYKIQYQQGINEPVQNIALIETASNYDESNNANWVRNAMINTINIQNITHIHNISNIQYFSNFYQLFYNYKNLVSIADSTFMTSGLVNNTARMFYLCGNLQHVNFESWDTSNVIDMSSMFHWCPLLQSIENFDTSKVINMSDMFYGCNNLTTIPNFNTNKVTHMANMLNNCWRLTLVPNFNTINVINMESMFYNCGNLTSIPNFNTSNVVNMRSMFSYCNNLTTIPNYNTINVNNMTSMFYSCRNLISVPNFNTSNVTNISFMFDSCRNLVDVPNWNTSNVVYMGSMFYNCGNLINIPNFDTSNVITMSGTFSGCQNLTNVPNWNTSNVTNMASMFFNCYNLTSVPNYNTINVTNMSFMFDDCYNLASVPNFNTSKVTNMYRMFYKCNNLTNASIQNIINMCLNSNINNANKNLSNTNSYSPLYNTKFDNSYYSNRLSELTAAGWIY